MRKYSPCYFLCLSPTPSLRFSKRLIEKQTHDSHSIKCLVQQRRETKQSKKLSHGFALPGSHIFSSPVMVLSSLLQKHQPWRHWRRHGREKTRKCRKAGYRGQVVAGKERRRPVLLSGSSICSRWNVMAENPFVKGTCRPIHTEKAQLSLLLPLTVWLGLEVLETCTSTPGSNSANPQALSTTMETKCFLCP